MFTFLRVASRQSCGKYQQQFAAYSTTIRPVKPNKPPEITPLNPWEKELYRLANSRTESKPNPYSNKSSQLPKPRQSRETNHPKQGTLTELKIWWGKSMALSSTGSIDLTAFAPPPAKRPNHWYQ